MNRITKTLYGIRHKNDDWKFTESKADRDALWNTIQNYSDVAAEWETCEKQIPVFSRRDWEATAPVSEAA